MSDIDEAQCLPRDIPVLTPEREKMGDIERNRGIYSTRKTHIIARWNAKGILNDDEARLGCRYVRMYEAFCSRGQPSCRWLGEPAGKDLVDIERISQKSNADVYTRLILTMQPKHQMVLQAFCIEELGRRGLQARFKIDYARTTMIVRDALDDLLRSLKEINKKFLT